MLFARYLGQPNPLCKHLAGRFFGRNATPLDEYGANLSSESFPGRGFTKRYNDLQYLIQDMMRLGNIDLVLEPVISSLVKLGSHILETMSTISQVSQASQICTTRPCT
jgi:hypothetical protein